MKISAAAFFLKKFKSPASKSRALGGAPSGARF